MITAKQVTYGYRKGRPVLNQISVQANEGDVVALTGVSGRGKSTLLYILAGLLTPWDGTVEFKGQPLADLADHQRSWERSHSFGFVFQDAALDPRRSIIDAVLEPALYAGAQRKQFRDRAVELLQRMEVDVDPERRPGEISGGQAQRVGVCRALLMKPAVIFADEPTGNLDARSAGAVLAALGETAQSGSAVIIATHDDRVIERCNKALRL